MNNFKKNTILKIILIISFISLITAYFIEHVLGHQPCNLCLIERIPYGLAIILVISNNFFKKDEKFIIILLIMIFVFSFLISFYHFGIEQNLFEESNVCVVNNITEFNSKEELLKQLQIKVISCKDVTFRIFGFSLTTINMIISLVIFITLIKILKNYEKYRK